jgi:hypothetical protein
MHAYTDGCMPGGVTPAIMQAMIDDPELMLAMSDPKFLAFMQGQCLCYLVCQCVSRSRLQLAAVLLHA